MKIHLWRVISGIFFIFYNLELKANKKNPAMGDEMTHGLRIRKEVFCGRRNWSTPHPPSTNTITEATSISSLFFKYLFFLVVWPVTGSPYVINSGGGASSSANMINS
jgi:hypothetical protein